MSDLTHHRLASVITLATGVTWGFYWLPVRALADWQVPGGWGTFGIVLAAALLLAPLAYRERRAICSAHIVTLVSLVLGGAAFALYSIGLVYGRVALVILLYFLSPVWSTLIARFLLGWPASKLRWLAILSGVVGLLVMLGAEGDWPVPRNMGEWMGLVAGLFWAIGTTGIRLRPTVPPVPAAFVFALGALGTTVVMLPFLGPLPDMPANLLGPVLVAAATGLFWWGLSVACLLWATMRLEPARVGILLMPEVLVGAGSAALLAGEALSPLEWLGGGFVLLAGLLEVWPEKRRG